MAGTSLIMNWAGDEAGNDNPEQEGVEEELWEPRAGDLTWPESVKEASPEEDSLWCRCPRSSSGQLPV